jgi:hypothetical protein
MVDTPSPGFARVDAFFTAKNDLIYVLLPRRPEKTIMLDRMVANAGEKITLLESGDVLRSRARGNRLEIEVPDKLLSRLPDRPAYVIKMAGVKCISQDSETT